MDASLTIKSNYKVSANCASFIPSVSGPGGQFATNDPNYQVTNLNINFTCTGDRPVTIKFTPHPSVVWDYNPLVLLPVGGTTSFYNSVEIAIVYDNTTILWYPTTTSGGDGTIEITHFPTAGTHNYKIEAVSNGGSPKIQNYVLLATEL